MDLSKESVALLLLFLAVEAWGASKSLAPWADAVKNTDNPPDCREMGTDK